MTQYTIKHRDGEIEDNLTAYADTINSLRKRYGRRIVVSAPKAIDAGALLVWPDKRSARFSDADKTIAEIEYRAAD